LFDGGEVVFDIVGQGGHGHILPRSGLGRCWCKLSPFPRR
jgi:hypothetical protein